MCRVRRKCQVISSVAKYGKVVFRSVLTLFAVFCPLRQFRLLPSQKPVERKNGTSVHQDRGRLRFAGRRVDLIPFGG